MASTVLPAGATAVANDVTAEAIEAQQAAVEAELKAAEEAAAAAKAAEEAALAEATHAARLLAEEKKRAAAEQAAMEKERAERLAAEEERLAKERADKERLAAIEAAKSPEQRKLRSTSARASSVAAARLERSRERMATCTLTPHEARPSHSSTQSALLDAIEHLDAVEAAKPAADRPLAAPVKPTEPIPHDRYGHGSLAARMAALEAKAQYNVARSLVDEQTLNMRIYAFQSAAPLADTPASPPLEKLASKETRSLHEQEKALAFEEAYCAAGMAVIEALGRGDMPVSSMATRKQDRLPLSPRSSPSRRAGVGNDAPPSEVITFKHPGSISEQDHTIKGPSSKSSSDMTSEPAMASLGAAPTPSAAPLSNPASKPRAATPSPLAARKPLAVKERSTGGASTVETKRSTESAPPKIPEGASLIFRNGKLSVVRSSSAKGSHSGESAGKKVAGETWEESVGFEGGLLQRALARANTIETRSPLKDEGSQSTPQEAVTDGSSAAEMTSQEEGSAGTESAADTQSPQKEEASAGGQSAEPVTSATALTAPVVEPASITTQAAIVAPAAEPVTTATPSTAAVVPAAESATTTTPAAAAVSGSATAKTVSSQLSRTRKVAIALYPYSADIQKSDMFLSFSEGARILVNKEGEPGGWWDGRYGGKRGWFPSSFCKIVDEGQHPESAVWCERDAVKTKSSPWGANRGEADSRPERVRGKRVSVRSGKLWQVTDQEAPASEPAPAASLQPPATIDSSAEALSSTSHDRPRHVEANASDHQSAAAPNTPPSGWPASIQDRAAALGEHGLTADALSRQVSSPPDALPSPWVEARTHEGTVYYWNQLTDETSWERPAAAGGGAAVQV